MTDFVRKPNRLPATSYVGCRWYFITICTERRRPLFKNDNLVRALLEVLRECCRAQAFEVYAYCFMPDHVHLELVGQTERSALISFLRIFKGRSANSARAIGVGRLWQKGFYDHILREGEDERVVAWYIFNNPVRKALVHDPRDYPFSGSGVVDWKKAVAPLEEFHPPWKKRVAG